jgi:hypothetical protein
MRLSIDSAAVSQLTGLALAAASASARWQQQLVEPSIGFLTDDSPAWFDGATA